MADSCPPRVAGAVVRGVAATLVVLAVACGERETPPPVETAPAVPPAAADSGAAPDTLVGDSLMARDTIPQA